MTHYEVLGVARDADASAIKRAYFALVRQFSPEKEPDKFRAIREAYETLSNPEKRQRYDKTNTDTSELSPEEAAVIARFDDLKRRHRTAEAVTLMEAETKKLPNSVALQRALATAYLNNGNSQKAATIAERLATDAPDDIPTLLLAAKCTMARGWKTKADGYLTRILDKEPAYGPAWKVKLSEYSHSIITQLSVFEFDLERIRTHTSTEMAIVCATLIVHSMMDLHIELFLEKYLPILTECAHLTQNPTADEREQFNAMFKPDVYFGALIKWDVFALYPCILEMLTNFGCTAVLESAEMEYVKISYIALQAKQAGMSKVAMRPALANLAAELFPQMPYDADAVKIAKNSVKMSQFPILFEIGQYRQHITKLRDEYPELYAYATTFYDHVLSASADALNREATMQSRSVRDTSIMELDYLGKDDLPWGKGGKPIIHAVNSYELQQPVRVEKIGRNDPCPCGSGKKYKKCHGAPGAAPL